MAANLMKPEYFMMGLGKTEKQQPVLIPPSAFEKPPGIANKDLEQAKKEIDELREEVKRLRFPPSHHTQNTTSAPDYADELIKRQINEIADLKSELFRCQQLYEQDSERWAREMKAMKDSTEQELGQFEKEARLREERLEQNIDKLSRDLQRSQEDIDCQTGLLQERLESAKNSLQSEILELTTLKNEAERKITDLAADNRQKGKSLEENAQLISQLKSYIGQTEEKHKPAQVWKVEKETLDNHLKIKQAENQKLQSHLQLLEVRFQALNDILAIQEKELSNAKSESKPKQHSALVTRWREKVFALLVQQKSSDIAHKNDMNKAEQQIQALEECVETNMAEKAVLQHSLTEKTAQLQIEMQEKERLDQELSQAQQVALCLDDQNKDHGDSVQTLANFVQSFETKYNTTMKALEEKLVVFKALCQRVSFASSRMDILKTQLLRKSAMSTPVNVADDSKKSLSRSRADEDMSIDSEEHLYQELERVMRERDSLATQVREDSSKWTHKMTETRSIYQTEIQSLKKTIEDLESDIQKKSQSCSHLTEELRTLQEESQENQDTIAQLQAELARHARGVETVLTDQRLKDDELYTEKINDLQRQLSETKREHAKTVVSLRQLERSRTRELERGKELLGTTEQQLNFQVQQLQTRLMTVEKERNTMVVTLRQEGLLNKLKTDRKEAVWLPLYDGTTDKDRRDSLPLVEEDKDEESQDFEPDIVSARGPSEPVESVLQDLKSLSAAIFDEPSSDLDENGD